MKATIRIVTPAAATAVAALLFTACAEKPVRIPGGAFVEEPYQGETVTRTQTQTIPSNGTDTMEAEIIYIDTDVPVGPVENNARQDDLAGLQGGDQQLQPVEQQPETKSSAPEGSVEYKVVKGDTLWGIGMVYGVSADRLAEINGISKNSTLKVGQVLMIPPDAKNAVGKPIPQKKADAAKSNATSTKAETSTKSSTTTKTETSTKASASTKTPVAKDGETLYVVKSGDNLSTIAYRHHVKLADLIAANKVDPKAILRVGQTLVIPAAGTKAASTSTSTKTSTTSSSTGTKTDTATTTKSGSAAATTTKTNSAATTTTKATETSQQKAGEGTGGIVEPLSGSSVSGSSSTGSSATTRPAATQPASSGSSLGLAPVSAVPDAGVLPIITDFDATIEELADYHGRSLVEMMRLNPQFKSGQRIPRGTSINLPFE